MSSLEFRRMLASDAEEIAAIEEMTFAMPWSRKDFWAEAVNENAVYIVGTVDNKIAAYAGVWISFEEAQVTNVAVHPDYRGQGIGTKLFARLIEEVKIRGATAITLEVRPSNKAAIKLYENFGLRSVGRRKGYYLDNGEDALIMWNTDICSIKSSNESEDLTMSINQTMEDYQKSIFFPIGQKNDAYAKYFKGQSYLAPVAGKEFPIFNVTFEPGCRNNWHIHHADKGGGQMLICVGGRGYYQEWGKDPIEMTAGTVITIPANAKHWHGAAPDSWFSHLAFEIPGENPSNEWLEPVTDEEYGKLK